MSYLWAARGEFAPGRPACGCVRCRSRAWRDLTRLARRLRRGTGQVRCAVAGHAPASETSWMVGFCRRCYGRV